MTESAKLLFLHQDPGKPLYCMGKAVSLTKNSDNQGTGSFQNFIMKKLASKILHLWSNLVVLL